MLYMFNHGLSTAALFLVSGFLISRRGSQLIPDFGGVEKVAPVLAGIFLVAGLSSLSLPGLSPFISEFLVLLGAFAHNPWYASFAVLGIVLAALYILLMVQRTMTGPPGAGDRRACKRPQRPRGRRARPAARADRAARLLPEAADLDHQPRRRMTPCSRSA